MLTANLFIWISFYKSLTTDQLKIPADRQLPDLSDMNDSFVNQNNRQVKIPYIIVADDAFPLSRNCMKPYPQKNLKKGYFTIVFQGQEELLKMDLEFLLADSESFIQKYLFNPQMLPKLFYVAVYIIIRSEHYQIILIVLLVMATQLEIMETLTKVVGEANPNRHISSLYRQYKRGIVAMMQKRLGVTLKITSRLVVKFRGNGMKYKYIFKDLHNDSLMNFVTK